MAARAQAAGPMPALKVPPELWPAGQACEWREPAALKPHPRNTRIHPEAQIAEIVASIAEHGFAKLSIVIDETDQILAGHGNVTALKRFGAQVDKVPVTVVRGWSDGDKRAFMLKDNKIPENSKWDLQLVSEELAELGAMPEIDIRHLGFSDAETRRLLPPEGEVRIAPAAPRRTASAPRSRALNVCCPKCGTTFAVTPGSV